MERDNSLKFRGIIILSRLYYRQMFVIQQARDILITLIK